VKADNWAPFSPALHFLLHRWFGLPSPGTLLLKASGNKEADPWHDEEGPPGH
jgi:hypothetical protein